MTPTVAAKTFDTTFDINVIPNNTVSTDQPASPNQDLAPIQLVATTASASPYFSFNSIELFLSGFIYFLNQYTESNLPFLSHILSILIQNQGVCCRAEKALIPSYL